MASADQDFWPIEGLASIESREKLLSKRTDGIPSVKLQTKARNLMCIGIVTSM